MLCDDCSRFCHNAFVVFIGQHRLRSVYLHPLDICDFLSLGDIVGVFRLGEEVHHYLLRALLGTVGDYLPKRRIYYDVYARLLLYLP